MVVVVVMGVAYPPSQSNEKPPIVVSTKPGVHTGGGKDVANIGYWFIWADGEWPVNDAGFMLGNEPVVSCVCIT